MSRPEDESPEFWLRMSPDDVARHAAALSAERRRSSSEHIREKVLATRAGMAAWLKGHGIEAGAGNRPFPVPDHVSVRYGDIRDQITLARHFSDPNAIGGNQTINAQNFTGIPDCSVDFVITAHVIEHLLDPIGSIEHAMRVIKPGGLFLLAVPDMRFTFDKNRPETPLAHVIRDRDDGGHATLREAYEDLVRYVNPQPENEIEEHVERHMQHEAMSISIVGQLPDSARCFTFAKQYSG